MTSTLGGGLNKDSAPPVNGAHGAPTEYRIISSDVILLPSSPDSNSSFRPEDVIRKLQRRFLATGVRALVLGYKITDPNFSHLISCIQEVSSPDIEEKIVSICKTALSSLNVHKRVKSLNGNRAGYLNELTAQPIISSVTDIYNYCLEHQLTHLLSLHNLDTLVKDSLLQGIIDQVDKAELSFVVALLELFLDQFSQYFSPIRIYATVNRGGQIAAGDLYLKFGNFDNSRRFYLTFRSNNYTEEGQPHDSQPEP